MKKTTPRLAQYALFDAPSAPERSGIAVNIQTFGRGECGPWLILFLF